jgi:pimeloyl-ACP methyl ester carboxylesterase
MAHVTTSVGRVFYEQRGAGFPVVMTHATLHDHRDYDQVASGLSQRFRTIALDWPAHGLSDTPAEGAVTGVMLADVLEDVVRELALPPAVYVGNSVGGYAAASLAITQPELVAGLVLVNAAGLATLNVAGRPFCRVMGVPALNRRILPRTVPGYMKARPEHDRAIGERAIARARTAAGGRLEMLDTGHVVFASNPERFLALVEPFIADAERARLPVG